MRRDKDCPYKNCCHDAPGGCENCDWHLAFEKFRCRITRMKYRLNKANAAIEMYRGVKGCRLNEMMDAELQGRCLTLPPCGLEDIKNFGKLYGEFMSRLRIDPPADSVMAIGKIISEFLKAVERATFLREKAYGRHFDE